MAQLRNDLTADELIRSIAGVWPVADGEVTLTLANTDYTYTIQDARCRFLIIVPQTNAIRWDLFAVTTATSPYLPGDTVFKVAAPTQRSGSDLGPENLGPSNWTPVGLTVHFQSANAGTKVTVVESY